MCKFYTLLKILKNKKIQIFNETIEIIKKLMLYYIYLKIKMEYGFPLLVFLNTVIK